MVVDRDPLRDWHRLFGLLLTDFFTNSPFKVEDITVYTMEDFKRDYHREHFLKLSREDQQEILESLLPEMLQSMPPEKAEQIRRCLDQLTTGRAAETRKRRRKR